MSTHKQIDKICCGVLALVLLLTVVLLNAQKLGVVPAVAQTGYASRLFDDSKVHTIDIVMDNWDDFIETCENEEYSSCAVVIDGEAYKNIGIRAKGNTSLSSVAAYGNNRYSFKMEFDCYESGNTYHGLDKISLNNLIQDNTYMKDYLTYRMMREFGVSAPLCSYAFIRVNGEDWGLYLAVEGVEESFLQRNYGSDYGNLYKPDSMDMGGGRGNGGDFRPEDMKNFMEEGDRKFPSEGEKEFRGEPERRAPFGQKEEMQGLPEMQEPPQESPQELLQEPLQEPPQEMPQIDGAKEPAGFGGPGGMPMGSSDVALAYSDDSYDSYQNIFDNAKTNITDRDKNRLIASLKKLSLGEEIEKVVDVEAVLRYFVVHNFVCNFDSYTGTMMHNYYLYEKDGKLSMIPWDYNLAFGGFEAGSDAESMVNYPIDSPVSGTDIEARPMLAWIFADERYTENYHEYFAEFLENYFYGGYLEEMITEVQMLLAPYVEQDPTRFCSYEEFEKGVSSLKDFCLLRAESVKGQLAGEIPTTAEGQKESPNTLIDASGVSLSDMGTMDGGMRKGRR